MLSSTLRSRIPSSAANAVFRRNMATQASTTSAVSIFDLLIRFVDSIFLCSFVFNFMID
jgi:hypothetical protein